MKQFNLEGMNRLRTSTQQAKIMGIIKDNEIHSDGSKPNYAMVYFTLGAISVLAVGVILYSIHRSRNPKEE
jgi:cytochrome oxidase assembly protein ShyY1